MNDPLSFNVGGTFFARRLKPAEDHAAIIDLGTRCLDYLSRAFEHPVQARDLPRLLPGLLQTSIVPAEYGLAYGIHGQPPGNESSPPLTGVLFLLRNPRRGEIWCISLLLLETSARGKGLGTKIHQEVVRMAKARGARRVTVSVANNNPSAWRFWHDHLGYREIALPRWKAAGNGQNSRELQYLLHNQPAPARPGNGRSRVA